MSASRCALLPTPNSTRPMSGSMTISPSRSGRRRPVFPCAKVVAAVAPGRGRQDGLFRLRQEELQADIGEVEAGRRCRCVIEEVDLHIGVGMAGFGAAGEPCIEHRARHRIGLGQRRDDAAGGPGAQESRAAGVEQPHRHSRADAGRTAPRSAPVRPAAPRGREPFRQRLAPDAAGRPRAATGRSPGWAG